jgi:hypothetical protein
MKSIRGLVLAALVVAALAAAPAGASASPGVSADQYPASLHGSQTEELVFTLKGTYGGCSGLSFDATLSKPAPSVLTSSVVDPTCKSVNLYMSGCQFELHPAGEESIRIGPAGCGPVRYYIPGCAITLPALSSISADYQNGGSGSEAYFNIAINDQTVEYTNTSNNLCGEKGTYNDLHINGKLKVAATNAEKKSIGTKALAGNLNLAGGGGEGESRLEAIDYPAKVTGERYEDGALKGKITLLDFGELEVTCKTAALNGGELSGPVTKLTLTATYSNCEVPGVGKTTASMNSCHYNYSGLEYYEADKYRHSAEIACNVGDSIKLSAPGGCIFTIPGQTLSAAQSPGGKSEMINARVGDDSVVLSFMAGSKVKYTATGFGCELLGILQGTYENGSVRSDLRLRG